MKKKQGLAKLIYSDTPMSPYINELLPKFNIFHLIMASGTLTTQPTSPKPGPLGAHVDREVDFLLTILLNTANK